MTRMFAFDSDSSCMFLKSRQVLASLKFHTAACGRSPEVPTSRWLAKLFILHDCLGCSRLFPLSPRA